jgi:hypothetical protein
MQQQATGTASAAISANTGDTGSTDRRKVWILTGYTISFLAMCGVLAYYFSAYITH